MAGIRLTLTLPIIPAMPTAGLTEKIRQEFMHEAGTLILDAIRLYLGEDQIYQLSPEYAKRKPTLKKFRRFPGKSADQPLILSGELYNSLTVIPDGDGFIVEVQEGKAMNGSFDYAEHFEEITLYLEQGLALVEDDLPELLIGIIFQNMNL